MMPRSMVEKDTYDLVDDLVGSGLKPPVRVNISIEYPRTCKERCKTYVGGVRE